MTITEGKALPKSWAIAPLGSIQSDLGIGVNPSRSPDEMFELYSVPSHAAGTPEVVRGREIGSNKQIVATGTVLLCKINPRINRVWVVQNDSGHRAIASTEWIPFFRTAGIEPRYLAYFLRQDKVREFLALNASGVGGSLMRVRSATLRDFGLAVAPSAEQERIADALDELLSDLDAGVAALERVRAKLEHYRAAVLKAAVEGTLTAEWRRQHPATETADALLTRILAERRQRWEQAQLAKFEAAGKTPPKDWKAKYVEPAGPDTTDLPALPEGWRWVAVSQLLWQLRSGSAATSSRHATEFPVLKSSAVRPGSIDLSAVNYLSEAQSSRSDSYLAQGDFLITRLSGSVEYVGCCAVVGDIGVKRLQYPDRIFCGKLAHGLTGPYLTFALRHPLVRRRLETAAKSTAGHQRISISDILPLAVPMPPIDEQESIVEAVEDQLSVIDHLESDLDARLNSAQALRQSILRHAFSGQLVPQDPNDEPASELLKRIAAEREERARLARAAKQAKPKSTSKPRTPRRRAAETQ